MAAAYLAIATCRGERERHAWLEGGEPRTAAVVPLWRPPLKGLTQCLAESEGSNLRRKSPVPATASRHAWARRAGPHPPGAGPRAGGPRVRQRTVDPLRASPRSSSGPPGWRTIPGTCGASSRRCGGACSAQPARPSSATRPRLPGGSPRSGRGSSKRPNAQSLALLCRRVGRQPDPAGAAHLGTAGQDAGAAPPLPTRQADLDVRAGGLPAGRGPERAAGGLDGLRPAGGAPTTAGSVFACWTGWAPQLGHQPVTVIWDNLGAHHAGDLHAWAATQPWLELAYLPSYAPELDPVEGLWANLKGRELANRCCADRAELIATAQVGSIRARRDRICCAASWQEQASPYESPATASSVEDLPGAQPSSWASPMRRPSGPRM